MTPAVYWPALLPQIFLGGGALVMLTLTTLARRRLAWWFPCSAAIALSLAAFASVIWLWVRIQDSGHISTIADTVVVDGFAVFLSGVIIAAVLLALLFSPALLRRSDIPPGEFCVLLLLSATGGVTLASSNDLIVLFLALEVLSIAVYVLAALDLRRSASQEAGLKYFVLGAFASAFFLYGAALLYGFAGSTKLAAVRVAWSDGGLSTDSMALAGLALLLVGLFFKVAAVPFHAWTPDVYQGSPSPAVAYMAAGVKAAAFAALLRLLVGTAGAAASDWRLILAVVSVVTILAAAALGVISGDVRRLLAYSSISHGGFVLVGVESASAAGVSASLFYLGTYAFMALGSFAVVSALGRDAAGEQPLTAYDGLGRRSPLLALGFSLLLAAQAGIPFTTGFWAKFEIISAAVDSRTYWLAAVAMLGAVVAAFLYLRLVVRMYLVKPPGEGEDASAAAESLGEELSPPPGSQVASETSSGAVELLSPPAYPGVREPLVVSPATGLVVGICAVFTLVFGVWPTPLLSLAGDAVLTGVPSLLGV